MFWQNDQLLILFVFISLSLLLQIHQQAQQSSEIVMTTRSTRRNHPTDFQQLSYQIGKQKKNKKKGKKQSQNKVDSENTPKKESNSKQQQKQPQESINQNDISKIEPIYQQAQVEIQKPIHKKNAVNPAINKKKNEKVFITAQQININQQHETILQVLHQFISHQLFHHIDQAKLRPTANSQIRQMRQKLKGNYQITQFQNDLDKIFRIFYQQSEADQQTIIMVKIMESHLMEKLSQQKKNIADDATISEGETNSYTKSNPIKTPKLKTCPLRKPKAKNIEKQDSISLNESFETGSIPAQPKRPQRKQSVVPPRPKLCRITFLQMASLGYNIRKLPSQDLALICYKFGDQNESKQGSAQFFNIQLEKLPKEVFFEMEAHVKTIFKKKNWKYEEVNLEDSDDDFMITSDSQSTK